MRHSRNERGCDEGHWHAHKRLLPCGLPEVVGTVHVHCSRGRLLRRVLEFHMCTINTSAHTKKSLETYLMILVHNCSKSLNNNWFHFSDAINISSNYYSNYFSIFSISLSFIREDLLSIFFNFLLVNVFLYFRVRKPSFLQKPYCFVHKSELFIKSSRFLQNVQSFFSYNPSVGGYFNRAPVYIFILFYSISGFCRLFRNSAIYQHFHVYFHFHWYLLEAQYTQDYKVFFMWINTRSDHLFGIGRTICTSVYASHFLRYILVCVYIVGQHIHVFQCFAQFPVIYLSKHVIPAPIFITTTWLQSLVLRLPGLSPSLRILNLLPCFVLSGLLRHNKFKW